MGCPQSKMKYKRLSTMRPFGRHKQTQNINRIQRRLSLPRLDSYKELFTKAGLVWVSETPITKSELEEKRVLFWDTAPTYGGRMEIWKALQLAFTDIDIEFTRSILNAVNIIIPNGNPCEGCYDEFGYNYEIPIYCLVFPENLIEKDTESLNNEFISSNFSRPTESSSSSTIVSEFNTIKRKPKSIGKTSYVKVRLSNEKNLSLEINPDNETIGTLKNRILCETNLTKESYTIRIVYLGRVLYDNIFIVCDEEDCEMNTLSLNSGYIKIDNKSIIQALLTPCQTIDTV